MSAVMSRSALSGRPVVAGGARPQRVQHFAGVPSMPTIPSRSLVVRRFKDDDDQSSAKTTTDGERGVAEKVADKVAARTSNLDKVFGGLGGGIDKVVHEAQHEAQTAVWGRYIKGIDEKGYEAPAFLPAFTRRREAYIGRIAMLGFFGVSLAELFLPGHPGVVSQISGLTGLSLTQSVSALNAIVMFNTFAFLPWSPTFSPENQRDLAKRPPGPPFNIPHGGGLGGVLGTSKFGFTKRNEIYNGRLSMIAFFWAVAGEIATGGLGPIAQLGRNLGIDITEQTYWDVAKGWTFAAVIVLGLAYGWGSKFQEPAQKESDIY